MNFTTQTTATSVNNLSKNGEDLSALMDSQRYEPKPDVMKMVRQEYGVVQDSNRTSSSMMLATLINLQGDSCVDEAH